MTAPPMRSWQNAVALVATILAAATLLPLAPALRLLCAGAAGVIILFLLSVRVRAHRLRRDRERVAGVYARIERIRSARTRPSTRR